MLDMLDFPAIQSNLVLISLVQIYQVITKTIMIGLETFWSMCEAKILQNHKSTRNL